MDDRCKAVAALSDPSEWVLDENTLELTPPAPGAPAYEGPCKFKIDGGLAVELVGSAAEGSTPYALDLPLSAPLLPRGTQVQITASRRDPASVGLVLEVQSVRLKTMTVKRAYVATVYSAVER